MKAKVHALYKSRQVEKEDWVSLLGYGGMAGEDDKLFHNDTVCAIRKRKRTSVRTANTQHIVWTQLFIYLLKI